MSNFKTKKQEEEEKILPRVPNQRLGMLARREETRLNSLFLKDKDSLADAISGGITFRYFEDEIQRQIFSVIARYYDAHNSLLTRQQFESIVAQMHSDEVAASYRNAFDTVFVEHVSVQDYHALKANIEARHIQRQALAIFTKYYDQIIQSTAGQKKIVEALQSEMAAIKTIGDSKYNRTASLAETIQTEVLPELQERRDHPENFIGMMTGWKDIDNDFHGFKKGRYMVVLAMEGGGKTTFMLNLARNFAVNGRNVVYVTIESGLKDTSLRVLTIHSAVSYNRIMTGGKSKESGLCDFIMQELKDAADDLVKGPGARLHWVQVMDGTSRTEILNIINRKRSYIDIDVVVIDYIGVVGKEKSYSSRPDLEVADISGKFRSWAMENNVLLVTAQQIKTDKSKKLCDTTPDKYETERIQITDVSDTKQISGAADYMLGVFIPDTKDRMRVYNLKHRQGWAGKTYTLTLDIESGRLTDLITGVGSDYADSGLKGAENRSKLANVDGQEGDRPTRSPSEMINDVSPLDSSQSFDPEPVASKAEDITPAQNNTKDSPSRPKPNPDLPPAIEVEPF